MGSIFRTSDWSIEIANILRRFYGGDAAHRADSDAEGWHRDAAQIIDTVLKLSQSAKETVKAVHDESAVWFAHKLPSSGSVWLVIQYADDGANPFILGAFSTEQAARDQARHWLGLDGRLIGLKRVSVLG